MKKTNMKLLNVTILITLVILTSIVTVCAEKIIASQNVAYSSQSSGLNSNNVKNAVDVLYEYCIKPGTFADYLMSLSTSSTVIADDGTADHNMRYTGKNPNNYITFAGEEWRIIGVFNNIDNGTGKKETRVKIIKSESFGTKQWHTSKVNIWKSAALNTELQSMSYASNSMVDNAVWYLGDPGGNYNYTTSQAYEKEKSTKVANGNNATWTGKVALMYPSDYGFASSACKNGSKNLYDYDASSPDCKGTNWLYLAVNEWLLTPRSDTTTYVRTVSYTGYVSGDDSAIYANSSLAVRPTVYLKSNVKCNNCSDSTAGTKTNPFQLS